MLTRVATVGFPLRWYVPGVVYEVTSRTTQERFLLRPGPASRSLIEGVLGRALVMFPEVRLHAYHFMSNHTHLLVSTQGGAQLAGFLGYVFGNVARELGRLHGWRGPFWARRARVIPICDDDALVARLRYVLSQGVKEGLIEHPEQWPGASSTRGLLGGPTVGAWIDRDAETRARRRAQPADTTHFTTHYSIDLAALPCWADCSVAVQRARVLQLIQEVVDDARRTRCAPPLGVRALLEQDPQAWPVAPASSPAPACHATEHRTRLAFRLAYRWFCDAFRAVARAVRAGVTATRSDFPPGSFPRPQWFVAAPSDLPFQLPDI